MALPSPKEIKELAKACRDSGIKTFKCGDVEFTLTDEAPISKPRGLAAQKVKQIATSTAKINLDDGKDPDTSEDQISDEALMMWSAMGGLPVLPADKRSAS